MALADIGNQAVELVAIAGKVDLVAVLRCLLYITVKVMIEVVQGVRPHLADMAAQGVKIAERGHAAIAKLWHHRAQLLAVHRALRLQHGFMGVLQECGAGLFHWVSVSFALLAPMPSLDRWSWINSTT